jgi:hypothetical protein
MVSIIFNPDPRDVCNACEDEHIRHSLAEGIQGSSRTAKGCMAQDCTVQDCTEPAVRTKAARRAEVASNRPAAAVVVAVRIVVAVADTGVPGHTAVAAEARAIGSRRREGMAIGCFAVYAVEEAQGRASSRLAVVAWARHQRRQQPDVLREACCRVKSFGVVVGMGLRQGRRGMVRRDDVGAR